MSGALPWSAQPIVGKCFYVADSQGLPVVSGPLPEWLAKLIAESPRLLAIVRAVAHSQHSVDEDGDFEFTIARSLDVEMRESLKTLRILR